VKIITLRNNLWRHQTLVPHLPGPTSEFLYWIHLRYHVIGLKASMVSVQGPISRFLYHFLGPKILGSSASYLPGPIPEFVCQLTSLKVFEAPVWPLYWCLSMGLSY